MEQRLLPDVGRVPEAGISRLSTLLDRTLCSLWGTVEKDPDTSLSEQVWMGLGLRQRETAQVCVSHLQAL